MDSNDGDVGLSDALTVDGRHAVDGCRKWDVGCGKMLDSFARPRVSSKGVELETVGLLGPRDSLDYAEEMKVSSSGPSGSLDVRCSIEGWSSFFFSMSVEKAAFPSGGELLSSPSAPPSSGDVGFDA
ncbi:hypothetical protein QR680_012040 [Steinernema hermaphroditum]|uniref:Uncharacterized protein n=1 Tax=Steinernema hermaphroditum TaxID=289476 RepID=A0AA39I318_9BILA|nr:hypothetical protein QR680_012040 [Steinernema hermaphroditum]